MQKKAQTTAPVPIHLRNAPITLMKDLGYGGDYLYNSTYWYVFNHFSLNLSFDILMMAYGGKDMLSSNNIFRLTW